MICPICSSGKLMLQQDAIVTFPIFEHDGIVESSDKPLKDISYLDNTWIECSQCHETSEENKVLGEILLRKNEADYDRYIKSLNQ